MPKLSIIILLLELQTQLGLDFNINYMIFSDYNLSIGNVLKNLLLISSLLSLLIGTIVGLAQTKIKRLLAYSTISHIGFILLALALNSEQSIDSLLFYIIQYTLTNLNIFLILIAISYMKNHSLINLDDVNYNIKDIKYISELKGQFYKNPLLSLSLTICLFSMAGIPPLIGFFSKQFVLFAAIQNGYYFISFIAILTSVISASYYLKIIKVLHTESEPENHLEIIYTNQNSYEDIKSNNKINYENNNNSILTNLHSFLISTLTLFILFFIFKPSVILNITQVLALSLFNL